MLSCLALLAAFAFSVVAPAIGGADETGGISGTVSGEGGGTLEGVEVCASGSASPGTPIACQATSSAGTYEITGLAAGQYLVEFTPPTLDGYLPASNSDVMVAAETVTLGVDATLAKKPPPPPTKITGTVTAEGSGPFEGVAVCLYVNPGPGAPIECKSSDSGGSYEFTGMAPGNYTVEFTPPGPAEYLSQFYLNAASANDATPVAVAAETVTSNIDATLAKKPPSGPAKISGVVTNESGAAAGGVKVCVQQVGATGPLCELTDPTGGYVFPELPAGEWGVTFNAQGTAKNLLSLAYPNREIWEAPVPVTLTPGEKEVINVALRTGGQISGTVRSAATGAPAAGVRVCLTEADPLVSLACLTTPPTGAYRFIAVWPGSFKVAFSAAADEFRDASPIADPYTTQWWNGQPTFGTAVPIVVAPRAAITGIDASLVTPSAPTTTSTVAAGGAVAAAGTTSRKPRCHKGYVSRRVKGKPRCVKVKHHTKKSHAGHKKHHKRSPSAP